MKRHAATLCSLLMLAGAGVAHGQELISNGSFELSDAETNTGNNIGVVPTDWLIYANNAGQPAATPDATLSNLAVGTATGDGIPAPSLTPFDGNQAEDGVGVDVWVLQNFTIPSASQIQVTFAIGGRDSTSASAASFWQITSTDNATVFATGPGLSPAPGTYVSDTTITPATLNPGTYTYAVLLANPHHVDGVSLLPVAGTRDNHGAAAFRRRGFDGVRAPPT